MSNENEFLPDLVVWSNEATFKCNDTIN